MTIKKKVMMMADNEQLSYVPPDSFHEAVTFTSQPTPPYYYIDSWINNGFVYGCCHERSEGESFNADDWVSLGEYVPTTPETTTVITRYEEYITDFSEESIAIYQESGAVPYAVYDDGTEVQVTWDQVSDPAVETEEFISDAEQLALANNQHFWSRDTATDGAGTGAFVTDEQQEAFLEAAAANFPNLGEAGKTDTWTGDGSTTTFNLSEEAANTNYQVRVGNTGITTGITKTTTSFTLTTAPANDVTVYAYYTTTKKPWHNILMNVYGIAMRMGTKNLLALTKSAMAFYDGTGNEADNVTARFGSDGAQIGKSTENHTIIDSRGVSSYDGKGNLAPMRAAYFNELRADQLTAATAYIESLTADNITAANLTANVAKVANLTAEQLSAATAYIATLDADQLTASNLVANVAKVANLTAEQLSAATAYIASLNANSITANQIAADHATVSSLDANYAHISNGVIDNAKIGHADVNGLNANYAHVSNGVIDNAKIGHADINGLDANYMHADMSNSDVAWIQNGTIKNGAISDAMINSVSANKLTAGTIDASNITVTNLNANNITTGTINGQRIGTGSLSLDKLSEDVYTETEVDNLLATMQSEIDGAIETWTGTAVPTLNNAPASGWSTNADKDKHVGDVYFVVNSQSQQNGYNYRFTKSGNTYSWALIKDTDITNALSRLSTAEGKITTFDSDITTLKTDTGTLKTKTQSLETSLGDKVDVTTFNDLEDTVDGNSRTISQHTTAISNKADNSTVTSVTNRVSKNEQDISGINTTISELSTTLESKADGSTVESVSNRLNTVSNTVDGHTSQLSSITNTQTSIQGSAVKSTVQLWFTKANTTAPNKPTAHITTNNASTANAWNLAVPTYNASYPNYYYCYEYEYLNGTYGWSAVTRDIATGEAQSTARTANTNASNAVSTANTANTNASNAVSTANTANTNASNAVSTANTANTNASNAVSTANTAASDANTAKTNAATAVSTANTANTNASSAVTTANTAKSTADKNLKESQQLWFTKANSTAPGKPTAKVTSTATTGNAWTTRVPTYNASYKYYFYCMQYIAADGTVTWSDVIYDQATTEAQSVARAASADLTEFHQEYATFKQTTQNFESTVGETYATKTALQSATDDISSLEDQVGISSAPYTEVEWVESNGSQYVFLDWKPDVATFGFEADFIIRNAFSTAVGAWRPDTNTNGYGSIFGTASASNVNDIQLTSYTANGLIRFGTASQYTPAGLFKTDKSRQQISLHGTSLRRGDGTTVTVTRGTGTSDKLYSNMMVFAMHVGVRHGVTGGLAQPSTTRIYSLKFYDGDTLAVDLVGAIRNRDNTTGLYDKVRGHFYPAPKMIYGDEVGDLGEPDTIAQTIVKKNLVVDIDNQAITRMLSATVPELDKLEDGQQITVTFSSNISSTTPVAAGLVGWDEVSTTAYGNVFLKLTFADGSDTDWVPCYYNQGTRLTSHYGSAMPISLTYRENVTYGATATSSGAVVMRAWYADPNYYTDERWTVYSDSVIAGLNGAKPYSLNMRDVNGNWTSVMNEASNANATGKTAYTGGLQLGNILYHNTGSNIAAGNSTGVMKESTGGLDFRYSVNGVTTAAATTQLQLRKPLYFVGTVKDDGYYYLDQTKWWTQTDFETGKVYVQIGTSYGSYYAVFLSVDNPSFIWDGEKLVEYMVSVTTAIEKRVTTAETSITQTKEQILLKANSSDVYTKIQTDGLISTEVTNRNAAIETSANAINLSVSQNYTTKTDFNNLKIGGRNLLINTGLYSIWDAGSSQSSQQTYITRHDDCITFIAPETKHWWTLESHDAYIPLEDWDVSANYTISVDVKIDNLKIASYYPTLSMEAVSEKIIGYSKRVYEKVGMTVVPTTNDWRHFEYTFNGNYITWNESPLTSGSVAYIKVLIWLYFSSDNYDSVSFRNLKLEKGNKATDWTPAPEDVENYTDTQVNAAKAAIKVTTDSITTEVAKKTDKTAIISTINQTAETVKIQASKVNITGDAVFSAINNDTGTTKINGGKIDATSITLGYSQLTNTPSIPTKTSDLTNDSSYATTSQAQGYANAKDAAIAAAAKRTYVSIRATAVDYSANTATLEATLYIDGTATTTGVTYVWMKDGTAISGATSRTYSVPASNGLNHAYSCKCTATV